MKKTYPQYNNDPKIQQEIAKKFENEFTSKTWLPIRACHEYTHVLLKSMLQEEILIAFGKGKCTDLTNEINEAADLNNVLTGAYDYYINASNYLFNMIEQGKAAVLPDPVRIIGMDGNFIFDQPYQNEHS